MNVKQKLLMAVMLGCIAFIFSGGRAEAAKISAGESHSPMSYRALCTAGTPVDFAAYPSNVSLNPVTGVMTYTINVKWQRCNSTETRAYAVYDGPEVCPLAGTYGSASGSGNNANDCVKYIGSPEYNNPGSSLSCSSGTNAQCVTSSFAGARRSQNQPSLTAESISIPMSAVNALWGATSDAAGSWTISNQLCQFYKTGGTFATLTNNSRCITIDITVSWVPSLVSGRVYAVNASTGAVEPPNKVITIDLCGGRTALTDNQGNWSYTGFNQYDGFCARIANAAEIPTGWYNGPRTENQPEHASASSYEWQVAIGGCYRNVQYCGDSPGSHGPSYDCPNNNALYDGATIGSVGGGATNDSVLCWDRGDTGFDFIYTSPGPAECSITTPSLVALNQSFSIAGSVTMNSGSSASNFNYNLVAASLPGGITGPANPLKTGTIAGGGTSQNFSISGFQASAEGVYNVTFNVTGDLTATCNTTVRVGRQPYFRVYGGDVQVGAGFNVSTGDDTSDCTSSTGRRIFGFNNGGANYSGAGSQLAVFSTGLNEEFTSAALFNTANAPPSRPKGLTLANDGAGDPASTYGGGISSSGLGCARNYYGDASGNDPGGSVNLSTLAAGTYHRNGSNLTITGGNLATSSGTGKRVKIYVNGNAYITGDITYDTDYSAGLNAIPRFELIVRGNIYVKSTVQQLSGIYIAQPQLDGSNNPIDTTGRFYTCGESGWSGSVPSTAQLVNECGQNRLIVYGAVLAHLIKLLRTNDTVPNAASGESYTASVHAAERFIFSPEVWLPGITSGTGDVQAVTTKPPVL